jgi:hypothetical protein
MGIWPPRLRFSWRGGFVVALVYWWLAVRVLRMRTFAILLASRPMHRRHGAGLWPTERGIASNTADPSHSRHHFRPLSAESCSTKGLALNPLAV